MNLSRAMEKIAALGGVFSTQESHTNLLKIVLEFPNQEVGKKRWVNYIYRGGLTSELDARENLCKRYAMDTGQKHILHYDRYR